MIKNFRRRVNLFITEKVIRPINKWLLQKSFNAARTKAIKLQALTGQKMWVFLWERDYVAMSKQEFKMKWHKHPGWKQITIQDWQKYMYEFDGVSEPIYSGR